jgi:hypothetical protein
MEVQWQVAGYVLLLLQHGHCYSMKVDHNNTASMLLKLLMHALHGHCICIRCGPGSMHTLTLASNLRNI